MNFFTSSHSSVKISFDIFRAENEKARVIFLTGRAEYYLKYTHFFQFLTNNRITVFAMDHRGQGASERMLEDPQKGFVEDFNFFVDDADFFLKNFVLADKPDSIPVLSISHSMGGAVSLLLGSKNPGLFKKMVFCSPMWGINFGKIPKKAVFFLSKFLCHSGKGENYTFGKGKYNRNAPFVDNQLTHNLELFEKQKSFLIKHPEYVLGGPTNRWVFESLKAINMINLSTPDPESEILLLQAEKDSIVDNENQNLIINKISHSRKIVVQNSWHELLYEENPIYSQTVNYILEFLDI